MKYLVPFMVLASLTVTPALAQSRPDDGRGYGRGWRGDSHVERGQGQNQYNQGGGRYQPYAGGRPDGRSAYAGRPDAGRPDAGRPEAGRPDTGRSDGVRGFGGRPYQGSNGALYAQRSSDERGNNTSGGQQNEAREGVRQGRFQSMGEVIGRLRQREPGQQLDADLGEGPGGRPVYRVRWAAKNGRIIDYTVDAQTGAILSEEGR